MLTKAELVELDQLCLDLEEARTVPRLGLLRLGASNFAGSSFLQRDTPIPTSLANCPAAGAAESSAPATLCPLCALERAFRRQGSAPRANGLVRVESCSRHAAMAGDKAPASVNPNAGSVAAFPKGRWS